MIEIRRVGDKVWLDVGPFCLPKHKHPITVFKPRDGAIVWPEYGCALLRPNNG